MHLWACAVAALIRPWSLVIVAVTLGVLGACAGSGSPTATPPTQSLAEIVANSREAVVRVEATSSVGEVTGTGFILDLDRSLVVTAYHVVEGASAISIRRTGEESGRVVARLVAFDDIADIAILEIPSAAV